MTILSDNTLRDWAEKYPALSRAASGAGGEKTFGAVLQAIEVVGVAGAMSYMNARHAAAGRQAYEVLGVPADLALGLLFSGLAITGYFGDHAKHAHNVGNGLFAAYACRLGTMWGGAAKAQFQAASGAVRGQFAPASGQATMHPVEAPVPAQYPWAA